MTIEQFWHTIDKARTGTTPMSPSASPEKLAELLKPLGDEDVKSFLTHFYQQLVDLNHWNVWGAGYVIAGGMGDDSFHYFRSWLIGKGEKAVSLAKTDPDALVDYVDDAEVDNELLEYVALDILEDRGIEDDPRDAFEPSADDEPAGTAFDEDEVFGSYRRLSAKFG